MNRHRGSHDFDLKDVQEPELYKDILPYNNIPEMSLDDQSVPKDLTREIFLTDRTFGEGTTGPRTLHHRSDIEFVRLPMEGMVIQLMKMKGSVNGSTGTSPKIGECFNRNLNRVRRLS
jgi:hypothetical protein